MHKILLVIFPAQRILPYIYKWENPPYSRGPTYNDQNAPPPRNSFKENDYINWDTIVSLKQLSNTDVSFATKRTDWVTGTVYEIYDDTDNNLVNLTDGQSEFFVYNASDGSVFKCLDNNNNGPSTVPPTEPSSVTSYPLAFELADGYKWKYMYSIPTLESEKFLMSNYIPVRTLTDTEVSVLSAATSGPWYELAKVQEGAVAGTIDNFKINTPGSDYPGSEGSVVTITGGGASDYVLTLSPSDAKFWDNIHANRFGNTNILLSNSVTKLTATVSGSSGTFAVTPIVTIPGTTGDIVSGVLGEYNYFIGPQIEIIGNGSDAIAYARITADISTSSGPISSLVVANSGSDYTYTTINIKSVENEIIADATGSKILQGSGATVEAIVSPPGGHGSDPVKELSAYHVAISTELVDAGYNNTLIIGSQDYRQIGIIKDAKIHSSVGTYVANSASGYDQMVRIVANTIVGGLAAWVPTLDEDVIGADSEATGKVVDYNHIGFTDNILRLTYVRSNTTGGSFMTDELIHPVNDAGVTDSTIALRVNTGGVAGIGTGISGPDLEPYSGIILYNENRSDD